MKQGVIVNKINGEVFLKQGSTKTALTKSVKLGVNVKCEITTGKGSYAIVSDNPDPESGRQASGATVFPRCRIIISAGRGFIKEIEILQGLAYVSASPGKRILSPVAEFSGVAWIDVFSDGRTVVANTRETIYNRKTLQAVTLDVNQQVLITEDNIGEPEPMDQRFYKVQEIMFNLGAFAGAEMYQQVAEKSDALLESYLIAIKSMAEQTGQDFEKLKEEARQAFLKQKRWAQSEVEKCHQEAEKITKTYTTGATSVIPINQAVKYQGIECKVISVKRESKSDEADLLSINVEAKNESQKQIFIFWNEESRLINEKGDIFPTDDYNLDTSFMPGDQAKGYLFIPINKNDRKFKLQFGKKSLQKVEMELDL